MKTNILLAAVLLIFAGSRPGAAQVPPATTCPQLASASAARAEPVVNTTEKPLPRLPAGVTELKFSEFFVSPIGNRGLAFTSKLRGLDGKRVRLLGYMVQEEKPTPGVFMLSPYPAQIHDHDNALADNLPPSVVHVSVPTNRDQPVPHSPRLLLLTGILSVGNRTEASGRISMVRLAADAPTAAVRENPVPNTPQ